MAAKYHFSSDGVLVGETKTAEDIREQKAASEEAGREFRQRSIERAWKYKFATVPLTLGVVIATAYSAWHQGWFLAIIYAFFAGTFTFMCVVPLFVIIASVCLFCLVAFLIYLSGGFGGNVQTTNSSVEKTAVETQKSEVKIKENKQGMAPSVTNEVKIETNKQDDTTSVTNEAKTEENEQSSASSVTSLDGSGIEKQ